MLFLLITVPTVETDVVLSEKKPAAKVVVPKQPICAPILPKGPTPVLQVPAYASVPPTMHQHTGTMNPMMNPWAAQQAMMMNPMMAMQMQMQWAQHMSNPGMYCPQQLRPYEDH